MAKLPSKAVLGEVAIPSAFQPSRINLLDLRVIGDAGEAQGRALSNLGAGIAGAVRGLGKMGEQQSQQENAVAGIEAQTDYLEQSHKLQKELAADPDYQNAPQKYDEKIGGIIDSAAAKIPDPEKRQLWAARQRLDATKERLKLDDHVTQRLGAEKLSGIEDNLTRQQQIYTDPNSTPEAKAAAEKAMRESIDLAKRSGLVDGVKADKWQKTFVQGAQWNEGQTRIEKDPEGLVRDLQPLPQEKGAAPNVGGRPGRALQFFMDKGMSRADAAAMVFNFQEESGKGMNPDSTHDGGIGVGIAGWNKERRAALQALAKERGTTERDFDTQLEFAWRELNGRERGAFDAIQRAGTPEEKAKAAIGYFRPAAEYAASRARSAGRVNDLMGDGPSYNPRYSELTPMQRQTLQQRAETSLRSKKNVEYQSTVELLNDDINTLRQTGEGKVPLDPEEVAMKVGPDVAQKWQRDRDTAWRKWSATAGMDGMSDAELSDHLRKHEPKPGVGITQQGDIYSDVKKQADSIRKLRANDPAAAVASDPQVQAALKTVDPNNPDSVRKLGATRVAAQRRLGIDVAPVTVEEAGKYAGMLGQAVNDPRRMRDLADATIDKIVDDWGEQLAPAVFGTVMQRFRVDKDASAAMYAIMSRRGMNAPVTPEDYQRLSDSLDMNARDKAMDWGDGERRRSSPTTEAKEVSAVDTARSSATQPQTKGDYAPGSSFVRPEDIGALRRKDMTAEQFDAKYGRGAALAVAKERGLK